jgi:subtilisin family serine protease
MDPALRELLRNEPADRTIEAIIRFRRPSVQLPGVRVVARFGPIATCRIRHAAVGAVRAHPDVVSLKSARPLGPEHPGPGVPAPSPGPRGQDEPGRSAVQSEPRRPTGEPLTGRGVVVGVVDWGLDVDHPNLKHTDGSTRVIALWDQRSGRHRRRPPAPYGYGVVHTRPQIDRALRTGNPFLALGYDPSDADRSTGAHGCHVTDIAVGNGRRGEAGVAPGADLVFVHLADRDTGGLANLGDSVRLLEAVDFIARTAEERPWVINLSMGRHGGPHDGTTLVELALDALLAAAPGRFVTQSAGNYHQARTHATGVVRTGECRVLRFVTDPRDLTPNELEIWYDGGDELAVRIDPPGGAGAPSVPLGGTADIVAGGVCGRIYHRAHDPNNGDHHVDVFLDPSAPAGEWRVTLEGRRVRDGRFHAWLERDEFCQTCQARFVAADATSDTTTGTIANGHLPLVLAAYDARSPARPPGRSSSAGPTRDNRPHPDAAAPGVGVIAARSAPRGSTRSPGLLTSKTGTSMASPYAAGAVALCLEYAGSRLGAAEIRRLVLATTDSPATHDPARGHRLGHGYLNIPALLTALRRTHPPDSEATMEDTEISALALAPARAYRELLYRPSSGFSKWLDGRFIVLARPGQRLGELQEGDVVLRAVLGDLRARGDCAIVTERGLVRARGNRPDRPAGWYAATTSPDAEARAPRRRARRVRRQTRVMNRVRRVPPGQVLLRARLPAADPLPEPPDAFPPPEPAAAHPLPEPPSEPEPDLGNEPPEETSGGCGCAGRHSDTQEDGPSDPGPWTGTSQQQEFRAEVLAKHIRRSTDHKPGGPQRDLREDELGDVPGTCDSTGRKCVKTATATAAAAGRLLAAANAALAAAQTAGDADALRTVRLTAESGYRSRREQEQLWLGHFKNKYYDRTRAARAKIAEGPYSEAAVDYMLRPLRHGGFGLAGRIAAPGFSNHQGGIAIDLKQIRTAGHPIRNSSDDAARRLWRNSWFHGWLRTHAAVHGFRPIPTEEWHWVYRPGPTTPAGTAHQGGGSFWDMLQAAARGGSTAPGEEESDEEGLDADLSATFGLPEEYGPDPEDDHQVDRHDFDLTEFDLTEFDLDEFGTGGDE